jgi:DNA-binding NarL/FixJ family response regulator
MIRVYLDVASPVTQAGLETLLREQPEIELAASASEADVAVRATSLEIDGSGLPAVVLTDETGVRDALRNGARAALPYTATPAQIVAAIQAVAAGLAAIPATELAALLPAPPAGNASERPVEPLTPREIEVLEMLAEGLSNKMLAYRLNISTHTAKFHVNAILAKLGASTRTEAVTRAIRLGLIQI